MAYNLESLLKILHQILHPHPHPRIQLDSEQKLLLESLLEKVNFLNQVFENPTWRLTTHGIEDLERRITDAAHDAEDVIESHLANHLLLLTSEEGIGPHLRGFFTFFRFLTNGPHHRDQPLMICPSDLQRVIQNFDLLKEEITKMMNKILTSPGASSSFLPVSSAMGPNRQNIVVGIDEDLFQLKDKLTGYQLNLEVIPIVGMGGIGKTTLAQNLYNDGLIVSRFDKRVWITISQVYDMRRILFDCLQIIIGQSAVDRLREKDNKTIALEIHKTLYGRRYLIVLDDVWRSQHWDSMRMLFPNNRNGSRVIVTTRVLNVANYVGSYHHQMKFLDDVQSWNLLRTKVFGEETCSPELERIGHVIANDCKGLPIAVHVISGILTQLPRTQEAWEEVARDVSLAATNTDDDQFENIMLLSYNHLPYHLKPCFLYFAAFPEDFEIETSRLVRLWVAEGLLKPNLQYESLEDVGKVYLKALADRNLILVCNQSKIKDNVKSYMMHDVMRELCIRKAREENFFHISVQNQAKELSSFRRIGQNGIIEEGVFHVETGRGIAILPRTFLLFGQMFHNGILGLRLLRVLDILEISFKEIPEEILKLINLRYLALSFESVMTVPISVLCNLQTICFNRPIFGDSWTAKEIFEIFMIPQLRHLIFRGRNNNYPMFYLKPGQSFTLQEDLQTLSYIELSSSLQELLETTPNLKKLGIILRLFDTEEINVDLTCLNKLETLKCVVPYDEKVSFLSRIILPPSLKKLSLHWCLIKEEHLNDIAMLPNLLVLKLVNCTIVSGMWEPPEGGFDRLKYLLLQVVINLKKWTASEIHYPRLEHLIIRNCWNLEEIPTDLGHISTLELIELQGLCKASAVECARKLQEEQLELDNDALQVRIQSY